MKLLNIPDDKLCELAHLAYDDDNLVDQGSFEITRYNRHKDQSNGGRDSKPAQVRVKFRAIYAGNRKATFGLTLYPTLDIVLVMLNPLNHELPENFRVLNGWQIYERLRQWDVERAEWDSDDVGGTPPTYEELKQALARVNLACEQAIERFDVDHPLPWEDFDKVWQERTVRMRPYLSTNVEIRRALYPLIPESDLTFLLEDDGAGGDKMTMDEFRAHCAAGGFVDGDGFAQLIYQGKLIDLGVSPSDVLSSADLSRFDGVVWYNK